MAKKTEGVLASEIKKADPYHLKSQVGFHGTSGNQIYIIDPGLDISSAQSSGKSGPPRGWAKKEIEKKKREKRLRIRKRAMEVLLWVAVSGLIVYAVVSFLYK